MKKHLKMIGLAAVAALAVMAVVGASSASAKVCSLAGTGTACGGSHGNEYTGEVVGKSGQVTLTSSFVRVTCASEVKGKVTKNGSPAVGEITSLTFGTCHSNLNPTTNSCTASTTASTGTPYAASVATGVVPNGTMTVTHSPITGTFTCNLTNVFLGHPTCRYTTNSASLPVTGGAPAIVHAEVSLAREEPSSGSCSATATWEGTYEVTKPTSLYLT